MRPRDVVFWLVLLLLLAGGLWLYGENRAAQALAQARRDSLQVALDRFDSLELRRATTRDSLAAEVARRDTARIALADTLARSRSLAWRRGRRADSLLAALAKDTSDLAAGALSVLGAALEAERAHSLACANSLANCDSSRVAMDSLLASQAATIAGRDSLQAATQAQLDAALRAAHPPFFVDLFKISAADVAKMGVVGALGYWLGTLGGENYHTHDPANSAVIYIPPQPLITVRLYPWARR